MSPYYKDGPILIRFWITVCTCYPALTYSFIYLSKIFICILVLKTTILINNLHGDTWRIKHDTVKAELNRLCVWSSLPATCEVFGLFSHLIPQEGLSRIERGRKRQAMVPDFQLEVPSTTGGKVSKLAELKVLNCCPTRYSPGVRDKAVDKRARLLQGEYRKKAKDTDRKYGGTEEGIVGPVENKLRQFGDIQGGV